MAALDADQQLVISSYTLGTDVPFEWRVGWPAASRSPHKQ